jgi:hypothetical protein
MRPRRNPRRGRLRVFEKMPAKSKTFFRFWDADTPTFRDVLVCPLSMYRTALKPLTLLGAYVPRSKRIYLDDMRNTKTFLHEASHHIVTLHMPHLYKTLRGRAVEEAVADIAAAVSVMKMQVPRGAGWSLIEMGLRLKQCRKLHFDKDGDPILEQRCILTALRAKPKLITRIF